MKRAYVTCDKVNGQYYIELTIDGEFAGGGTDTNVNTYERAYEFACQVARSKGARVEQFRRL